MLRNGRERNPERLRQHARWFLSMFQKNEDPSASWMRDRVKHVVLLQRPHRLFAPWVVTLDSLKSDHPVRKGLIVQLGFEPIQQNVGSWSEPRCGPHRESAIRYRQEKLQSSSTRSLMVASRRRSAGFM